MTTPHLDDEALSAALDGAATPAEEAHLASCAECSARLASLGAVARAVATPVSPRPAAEVDLAIARAVAAGPGARGGIACRPSDARPKPFRGLGPAAGIAAGIAAALLVVGGLVAVFRGASSPRSRTAASSASGTTSVLQSPGLASGADSAVASGGDLGDQSDPAALARRVEAYVSRSATGATGPTGAIGAPTAAAAATPAPAGTLAPRSAPPAPLACDAEARSVLVLPQGGGVTVAYTATLRWLGQPAVVVVFSRPGGLAGLVMSVPGCSVLARLPF